MAEVVIDVSLASIADLPDALGLPGGGTKIVLDPASVLPGFPPLPTPPTAKTSPTSLTFTVVQKCPGFPACGRKGQACEARKSSPSFDFGAFLNIGLPPIPGPTLPKLPKFEYDLQMPALGFPVTCPNLPQPAKPADTDKQPEYDNKGITAPQ